VPEAIEAGDKAFQLMPEHPDAMWIHAWTMAADSRHAAEAVSFVDTHQSRVKNPAELLVAKAYALYVQSSGRTRDEATLAAAFAAFEDAERADSSNVNAWYLHGQYLDGVRRSDAAYPLLKKAVAL